MGKHKSKKKQKDIYKTRVELLNYIVDNVNDLSIKDRKTIMKIIAIDIGTDNITDCTDGCRMIIDNITPETLDSVLEYMTISLNQ